MTQHAGRACRSIRERRELRLLAALGTTAIVVVLLGSVHVPSALACTPQAPTNTALPVMTPTGTRSAPTVLSTTTGSWQPVCVPMAAPTYRWYLGANPISPPATSSSYTTAPSDYGAAITVRVTRCDSTFDDCNTVTATGTAWVASAAPTPGSVAISGTVQVGQTLTATPSGFNLGVPTATYSYQWQVSDGITGWTGATGSGSTTNSYTVVPADDGQYLRVTVTATNVAGSAAASADTSSVTTANAGPTGAIGPTGAVDGPSELASTQGTGSCSYTGYYWAGYRIDSKPAVGKSASVRVTLRKDSFVASKLSSGGERSHLGGWIGVGSDAGEDIQTGIAWERHPHADDGVTTPAGPVEYVEYNDGTGPSHFRFQATAGRETPYFASIIHRDSTHWTARIGSHYYPSAPSIGLSLSGISSTEVLGESLLQAGALNCNRMDFLFAALSPWKRGDMTKVEYHRSLAGIYSSGGPYHAKGVTAHEFYAKGLLP